MEHLKAQAEQKLGEPTLAAGFFITPGSGSTGDIRLSAMVWRTINLFSDDSGLPRSRMEDSLNGYVGAVFVAVTDTHLVIFAVDLNGLAFNVGQELVRCARDEAKVSYSENRKKQIEFSTPHDQRFTLTAQDEAHIVKGLVAMFQNNK